MFDGNVVTLTGRLGADPDLRYTQQGKAVAEFRMASNVNADEVMWISVVTWEKIAENVNNYLRKGSRVFVSGKLKLEQWETQDGDKRSQHKITANQVVFLDTKKKDDNGEQGGDIPF